MSSSQQEDLDCLQSDDVFMVFMPSGNLSRDQFVDLRPLLRQSLVAACAAFETYLADKAMDYVGHVFASNRMPTNMRDISLTVADWVKIEENYKRRRWGIRSIVEDHIRLESSTAPNRVGKVLSIIGVNNWSRQVDRIREVGSGTTESELLQITRRRNLIAHTADRKGRGRASIQSEEVQRQIETIKEVVQAIEKVLDRHFA